FDQWLLLNLNDESPDLKDGTPLSVLTVQKRDRAGQVLKKIKVHFRDYQIAHDKRNRYTLELDQSANGKCYACHSNGVRELIARHTPVLQAEPLPNEMLYSKPQDFAYQRLLEFNRRLRSYGSPDWDHKIHRDDHGPILGAEQGCTDCHNNQSRGSLSVSTSPAQIKRKILEDLTMPPVAQAEYLLEQEQLHNISNPAIGQSKLSDLREKHRRILDDYEKSRLPTLTKWLKEVPCESGSQL
ncbi:MAG: hypothetical protein NTX25_12645, partial [Proteobacteria bacterium]|nr:hypothetical protein [Pseudomonadota bacterium]